MRQEIFNSTLLCIVPIKTIIYNLTSHFFYFEDRSLTYLQVLVKINENCFSLLQEADTNIDEHLGKLDFDEFVHFYKTLSMRPELYALLREYSCGKEHMTGEDLELFLKNEQGLPDADEKMCCELIMRYEPVPENISNNCLGIDGELRHGVFILIRRVP